MDQAAKDNNNVNTLIGTSNADGSTPLRAQVNPTTHVLQTAGGTGGTDLSGDIASRDNNAVTTILAASSADGVTPVPVYIDAATNKLLLKST